ncbi:uncharacterized protein [Henckelia pumila]|uniref:uncharacterized protein n=1 Tax=Henckelia pumila TaxID=405737 RepID=UPI003C6E357D
MGAHDVLIDDKGSCSVKNQVNQAKMEDNHYEDVQILSKADALQGKSIALTLESSTNIVAYGTIICVDPQKLLHGVPLPKNCYRVSIDVVVDKSAPLPFPITNECEVVGDTLGTHVAWPQHLIVEQDKKPRKKDLAPPKEKHVVSPSVPMSLHMMYCYSKHALGEGRFISLRLDRGVFDDDCVILLHCEDIDGLYHVGPISGNCVIAYIWYLYTKMLGDNKEGKFKFVNPHRISDMGETTHDKKSKIERLNQRASALANRMSGASVDQLVLAPCNIGYHWILTIIQPYKDVIYVLDSLSHRIRDDD